MTLTLSLKWILSIWKYVILKFRKRMQRYICLRTYGLHRYIAETQRSYQVFFRMSNIKHMPFSSATSMSVRVIPCEKEPRAVKCHFTARFTCIAVK